jgi:ribokinase
MTNILVVGSLNMDLVVQMPAIPRPGETLLGGRFATFPGGKGANQAVAAARLGAQVTLVGRVGNDGFGKELLQVIYAEGIETKYVGIDPNNTTGVALITVDAKGENSISVASGANFTLTVDEVKSAWEQVGPVDMLVMPLETPMDTIRIAARLAKASGVRVILNPAPAQELDVELLRSVDVIVPNESEAEHLTGKPIRGQEDALQAGVILMGRGVRSVVLTLGEKGALIIEGRPDQPEHHYLPAYQLQTVDTTAAGDCFVGALATRLGEGFTLHEAAAFATAAAAISITRQGAQPSLPKRDEVDKFLQERTKRS